ncbi:cadherin-10-like isoform X1 [Silurus meridionalis]|uniref:cadherin-10-like isoform X1 n=1 Tax=Silurus meridionalis TaxID=175797 RepID=UPI001EEB90D2|nr:cadherin-10-like isoform X1 [Silurus meridionalis]XP_046710599.1 cadherin-10-like isoform X1 [Silurus meridionalis]
MRTPLVLLAWLYLWEEAKAMLKTTGDLNRELLRADGPPGTLRRFKRGWMWNQFFLLEEYTGNDDQYVGKLHSDKDREDGKVKYVLSGEGAGTIFVINENSGDLHATRRLDREEKASYTLSAKAVDKATGRDLEGLSTFIIKIHDINDNEPKFTRDPYMASVQEMADVGTFVVQVTATDADDVMYGNSAKVVYSILQGQPYFSIEPETGIIRTALPNMKREIREHYQVVIQAKDMMGQLGGLTGTTTVNITLIDVNNNPPRFTHGVYHFSIPELAEVGSELGVVKATDADTGKNAEMTYRITDEQDTFRISTDPTTQEGVLILKKPLDYERRASYTLMLQVENVYLDPRFHTSVDTATVKISVEDVNEPPVFKRPAYVIEVKEDASIGTVIGAVSAVDPDANRKPVKYMIDWHTDMDHVFNIHPNNGSLFISRSLDREEKPWHNISVQAAEHNGLITHVPVYIKVLDVNDNAPTFDAPYEPFVCEDAGVGQAVQTVSASDADQPNGGHRFFFRLAPEPFGKFNFSVRDNKGDLQRKDNTATILTLRSGYSRIERSLYLVPVVIADGDVPAQSSTNTLTIRVCLCDQDRNKRTCEAEAFVINAGLSTGALVAILLCIVILLMIVVLFTALKGHREKLDPLIVSKEDVRDNVVSYDDEGGGEEDTQAFDIGTLRKAESLDDTKQRRDIAPEILRRPAPKIHNQKSEPDIRDFISLRLSENDLDPAAPPYDSLATYAYEGNGSAAESLSSLESVSSDAWSDYEFLTELGPRFKRLADMYGGDDSES